MADEGTGDTFVLTLAGREMTFKRTSGAQMMMLQRFSTVVQAQMRDALASDDNEGLQSAMTKLNDAIWGAVESRFTSPADLEFVQLKIIGGQLEEEDLMRILSNGFVRTEPADDADPPVPVKKKAAAKKTANPRRATR